MFDFEKLEAYNKAKAYYLQVTEKIISLPNIEPNIKNQLRRSATSITLNIAEGTSRFSKADKRNFYIISRGSLFETVAIIDLLCSEGILPEQEKIRFYQLADELSRMLFTLIQLLKP